MKIAVYHNLTPGGADRAFYEIIKRLIPKHKIDVYKLNKNSKLLLNKLPIKFYNYEVKIPENFLLNQFFINYKLFKIHKEIANQINNGDYDLVLLSDDYLTRSPILPRYLKVPSLYFCQTHFREFYGDSSIYARKLKDKIINYLRTPIKNIDKGNVKKITATITNSSYMVSRLNEIYGVKAKKVSLGTKIFKGKIFGEKERKNYFFYVGPMAIFKGLEFIIKSVALLPDNLRYTLKVVANGGRDKNYLKSLANKLKVKLEIIKGIYGGTDDKRLRELYNRAKLFLYAPYDEPFGLVVLEAMSFGLPLVAVSEGGFSEAIIDGKNGWKCKRDHNVFSKKIQKAIELTNNRFRNETAQSVKSWSWDITAKEIDRLIIKTKENA